MACLKRASDLDDQSVCTVDDTFLNKDSSQTHLCHLLVETDSELRGPRGPLVSDRRSAAGNQMTTCHCLPSEKDWTTQGTTSCLYHYTEGGVSTRAELTTLTHMIDR